MLETKEQIRTELINELVEWVDKVRNSVGSLTASEIEFKILNDFENKFRSLLPTETPEKIAERKAEELLVKYNIGQSNTWLKKTVDNVTDMLIEALLTDIKK